MVKEGPGGGEEERREKIREGRGEGAIGEWKGGMRERRGTLY